MSMSSCDAGKTSPAAPRSTKPRVNPSTSVPPIRTGRYRAPPMSRKPFVVNETVRKKVRHLAGVGVRQDDIARLVGCAPKTLRKRCRDDLDRGVAEANAVVSGNAAEIHGFCAAVPMVRIRLPPADSPSLSRSHFRASRTRAFPAGVRGSLDDGVSRDAAGFPLRANRRQCLCRAIFQYRSAADAVSGNATTVRTKSRVSGL